MISEILLVAALSAPSCSELAKDPDHSKHCVGASALDNLGIAAASCYHGGIATQQLIDAGRADEPKVREQIAKVRKVCFVDPK